MREDVQKVYLDPWLVDRECTARGWSHKALAIKAEVDLRTVDALFADRGLLPAKAYDIATALGRNVLDLLSPLDPLYKPPSETDGAAGGTGEWQVDGYLDQGRHTPNGLYYIVCRMQHRHTPSKRGRGKFYHLSRLPTGKLDGLKGQLIRHAEVCARVGTHPHVAVNLSSAPVANHEGWWVVDDWVGARTLADQMKEGPFPQQQLPRLLEEVAQGLAALHRAGVVFRELAPSRVLLAERDGRAVLTDFELARLLDGVPSGQRDWPEDHFRAPEIDGGDASVQSDLYSFGRIVVEAICGAACESDRVPVVLGTAGVNKKLAAHLRHCLNPVAKERPPDVGTLLPHLAEWRQRSRS